MKTLSEKKTEEIKKFTNSMIWFAIGSYVTAILYEVANRIEKKNQ